MVSVVSLHSLFSVCEGAFFNLLRSFEELSSELRKRGLDSKEFVDLLETLYYSRDKLNDINRKTSIAGEKNNRINSLKK